MNEGAAEPAIVLNDDGSYTLFFTGLHGEERLRAVLRSTRAVRDHRLAEPRVPLCSGRRARICDGDLRRVPKQRQLCPMLNLSGQLVRSDGKVVWQNTDFITVNNKEIAKSPHKLEEFIAQPELLRESFQNAVRLTTKMLIDDMRTQVGKL